MSAIGTSTADSILALSKLKALADDNFNVAQIVQFLPSRVKSIVRKEETVDN